MRYLSTKNRSILQEMVRADFKVRYQSSVLGYLWSVLRPLFLFAILYVVFTYIFKVGKGVPHYPVYLLLGIVIWTFFTESTVVGMSSVVAKGDLIRKIAIPRYLTVLSSTMSALINLCINLVVVIIFALLNGVDPNWRWLLLPLVLGELFMFSTALAFFFSALYVKFRDITYIWEVGIQAAFYATPVIYPLTLIPKNFRPYFFINPMAQIIQDARYVFVTQNTMTVWNTARIWSVIPVGIVVFSIILSKAYFKQQAKWFAENI
ncbi:MAG: ABC transporter permease [Candidatus Saccharibacteria bacterium]|nr:ABC transporter permease [Candidatus Saccharibacteria bacterium]